MEQPTPSRIPSVTDIVNVLYYGGKIFHQEFCRSFPIDNNVRISYGLNQWMAISMTITGRNKMYTGKVVIYGLDGINSRKKKSISFTNLSLCEKRDIYDALRIYVGLNKFF